MGQGRVVNLLRDGALTWCRTFTLNLDEGTSYLVLALWRPLFLGADCGMQRRFLTLIFGGAKKRDIEGYL